MKNKIMSIDGNMVLVLEIKEDKAIVLKSTKDGDILNMTMKTIDADKLTAFDCPYYSDTDPTRLYCVDGKCEYPIPDCSPSMIQFACMKCKIDSYKKFMEDNYV